MTATHQTDATATAVHAEHGQPPRRLSTETKSAFKTTEFVIYVVAVLGVLLGSGHVAPIARNDPRAVH